MMWGAQVPNASLLEGQGVDLASGTHLGSSHAGRHMISELRQARAGLEEPLLAGAHALVELSGAGRLHVLLRILGLKQNNIAELLANHAQWQRTLHVAKVLADLRAAMHHSVSQQMAKCPSSVCRAHLGQPERQEGRGSIRDDVGPHL